MRKTFIMNVGKNIKQIRELKNFTQTFVAEKLNMSIGGYSKIESGQSEITISKLKQVADILETDINTILNFDTKNIFNQCHNQNSVILGNINTLNNNGKLLDYLSDMQNQIAMIKESLKTV